MYAYMHETDKKQRKNKIISKFSVGILFTKQVIVAINSQQCACCVYYTYMQWISCFQFGVIPVDLFVNGVHSRLLKSAIHGNRYST